MCIVQPFVVVKKLETTQVSIKCRMYKQAVVCSHNGILFGEEKELPHQDYNKFINMMLIYRSQT